MGRRTAGDYVVISSTTAGNCHDSGIVAASPLLLTGFQVIGSVTSTNAGAGSYALDLALQNIAALGGVPTAFAGTGAGTSPSVSILAGGRDRAGVIQVVTGSTPAASANIVEMAVSHNFPTFGACTISPNNANAANVAVSSSIYVTSNTTGFFIFGVSALSATTTYQWAYQCNGY